MSPLFRGPRRPAYASVGTTLIRVRDVVVEFGEKRVLDGIDLDIRAGEVLAIVGPNGAGKSTLLNVITGDAELVSGNVEVDGHAWHAWTGRELAMRRAVLLQQVDVSFPFTALEVTEMGRSPWANLPESQNDEQIVHGALARTETSHLVARSYSSLSGGERARVALARVLSQTAAAMLLDEPTAALDIRHQEQVLATARRYAATGSAVVVIIHDLDLAGAYADRVAVLAHGRIAADGPPEEVFSAELLSHVYDYPVHVVPDPITGAPVIVPIRTPKEQLL
ncbi:heme ABC transporter ATP-binding protein [Brevibacterium sp.]|jgi:iron complex transport system ATP-binding protein|uniref:heme ABC transporter ATP-binding protein n=1 Tax=Brevibacterium sp. TaxID=1701 RepID=UPI0025BD8AA1|nr:heme ABC transporter ATP-binding protein [Brevibacterium sp.]